MLLDSFQDLSFRLEMAVTFNQKGILIFLHISLTKIINRATETWQIKFEIITLVSWMYENRLRLIFDRR